MDSEDNYPESWDYSREYILTKLVCTSCGSNLNTSNKRPKTSECAEGQPTGRACAHINIYVYPCNCSTQAQKELDNLRKLIKG